MKPIVVPVNFSGCAACAAHYAAELALLTDGEIHLIHVVTPPFTTPEMTQYAYDMMVDSANTFIKAIQIDLIRRTHNKIPIHTHVETGTVYGQVETLCNRLCPYAVILGASGPSFEKAIGGSPVGSLLHLPFPVLVVPEQVPFHRFQDIVLACDTGDLTSGLPHSLPLLKEWQKRFDAHIHIVTIENGGTAPVELNKALQALHPELHLVHHTRVEEGLFEYLGNHPADLVIVFPKKHRFIEFHSSQSRKLARHSPVPILSLHEA
ncbi:universal stress protein [Dinghuibacter silviterrae]|uniref:Nucleotide-binding universal stress UspA family protein n=1 Tax=Dinghuibacter silviterrae TaxID=1539049 RepID=A0A4R8DGB7_9BACT|nr:universal stress protein [Dinghuibacter silviterrae]TDW96689.1 nucleotide-binding universal stress UspA family protein [Dinghuibacter silviterrae]